METIKIQNWEEDFDRKWFKWEVEEQNCSWSSTDSDELKAFFKSYVNQLLQDRDKELIEKIERFIQEQAKGFWAPTIEEKGARGVLEFIKQLK